MLQSTSNHKIKRASSSKFRNVSCLLFLLIFSFSLRLGYMNAGLFLYDSVKLAQAVEKTYATGTLHGQVNGRYGSVIINLITYAPLYLTGIESAEKSVIITNILFASLSILLLFIFVQQLFKNYVISFSSALLYSVSPVFLSITTYGKPHGIEIFFILAAFVLLNHFYEKNSPLTLALSSFLLAFSILVRESALIFVPLYYLLYFRPSIDLRSKLISFQKQPLKFKNLFLALSPFILVFGLSTYYYLYDVIFRTLFSTDTGTVFFVGFFSPVLALALSDIYFNLSALGILLTILGFFILFRSYHNQFYAFFFLLWITTFFYFGNTSGYSARYLAIVSIPFFVSIAIALDWIYKKTKVAAIGFLLILSLFLFLQIQPVLEFRSKFSGPKEYALWLKNRIPSNSTVIVMDDAPFIEYYAGLTTKDHPINNLTATNEWVKEVKTLLENDVPVYIVSSAYQYDESGVFRVLLNQNFDLQFVGSHLTENYHKASIRLNKYESQLFSLSIKN